METLLTITPAAARKISELMAAEEEADVLRVAIQGGGCSGFQYALGFDLEAQADDHQFESEGVPVVVDKWSAPYLRGATLNYVETIAESGFSFENPNAAAACGCGHSFQPGEEIGGLDEPAEGDLPGCGSSCR